MKKVNNIIKRYKDKIGEENFTPPIDLEIMKEVISEAEGIEISLEPLSAKLKDSAIEAFLIPFPKKFIIKTQNPNWQKIKKYRERMSICHEFAHILCYKTPLYHDENKCFKIARELLVPEEMIKKSIGGKSELASFNSFADLCKKYKVSGEIMAYRLTTDTSILKDTIITFLYYKKDRHIRSEKLSSENFEIRSFLSPELGENFPYHHGRRELYKKIWEKIEKKDLNSIKQPLKILIRKKWCKIHIYRWTRNNLLLITKIKDQIA